MCCVVRVLNLVSRSEKERLRVTEKLDGDVYDGVSREIHTTPRTSVLQTMFKEFMKKQKKNPLA
jgi:hypothetical protein